MKRATQTTHFHFWLWLVALIDVIVPRQLAARVGPSCATANTMLAETARRCGGLTTCAAEWVGGGVSPRKWTATKKK